MNTRLFLLRRLPLFALFGVVLQAAGPEAGPRERISINADWRFQKGDPPGVDSRNLLYDVLPAAGPAVERPAEFTEAASALAAATHPVLKPLILPTGNRFVKDPARRFTRPAGDPAGISARFRR